jgi:hypothetical protein
MRVIMGVWKSKDGVYYVRKKVPAKLEQAVATVLEISRPKVAWLKRSLRTKDLRAANIRAKPVLMQFDRLLAKAEALRRDIPLVTDLSEILIERMAAYLYAWTLEEDEEIRRDGTGSEEVFQDVAQQLREAGISFLTPFPTTAKRPSFGLSDREMRKVREDNDGVLPAAKEALARGDISFVREQMDELLAIFRVNLDPCSKAYRQLGIAVLKRFVQALQAIERRNQGEVIETPRLVEPAHCEPSKGGMLSAALVGWKRRNRRVRQPFANLNTPFAALRSRMVICKLSRLLVATSESFVRLFRQSPSAAQVPSVRRPCPISWLGLLAIQMQRRSLRRP